MREPYLINPQETIRILKKYNVVFNKRFGQNFLIDGHVLDKVMRAADVGSEDVVLEIGPGIGTITQYLSAAAKKVIAVEIDRALMPVLAETLSGYDNVVVLNQDILRTDIAAAAREENGGRPLKVVANLPYYITTPIMMRLMDPNVPVRDITVMVQKEAASRMQAGPGTKSYGALSLAVRYYAKSYIAANVPPNCFIPRPDVSSAVIRLVKYDVPPMPAKDEKLLFDIIRASFGQRRKTLINGLKNSPELSFTKGEAEDAVKSLGKGMSVRGESLTLEEFVRLSNRLARLQ